MANKIVIRNQLTVCWYVDDIKFLHNEKSVVEEIINKIENKFDKLTITQGNKQTYLGMDFEIENGKLEIDMKEYLKDCINDFLEVITSAAKTPGTKSFLKVSNNSEALDVTKNNIFHSIVQKLLHVSKQTMLDLQVAVGFLCTRVKYPDCEDWKK